MNILGLLSSHDCAFSVLENGVPTIHAELERYIREKEPQGDAFAFFQEVCGDKKIDAITVCHGFIKTMREEFPEGIEALRKFMETNKINLHSPMQQTLFILVTLMRPLW